MRLEDIGFAGIHHSYRIDTEIQVSLLNVFASERYLEVFDRRANVKNVDGIEDFIGHSGISLVQGRETKEYREEDRNGESDHCERFTFVVQYESCESSHMFLPERSGLPIRSLVFSTCCRTAYRPGRSGGSKLRQAANVRFTGLRALYARGGSLTTSPAICLAQGGRERAGEALVDSSSNAPWAARMSLSPATTGCGTVTTARSDRVGGAPNRISPR